MRFDFDAALERYGPFFSREHTLCGHALLLLSFARASHWHCVYITC